MASFDAPKTPAPAPKHPRYVRADKPVHAKPMGSTTPDKSTKPEPKEAPVVFSDWASI